MMLPPVPQSPEDENPGKSSSWDYVDVQKSNINNFEADLSKSDFDNFERDCGLTYDYVMPNSFAILPQDSVQAISPLDEPQYVNEDLIPATRFKPKEEVVYERPLPLSQPLINSQEDTYGEHSVTTSQFSSIASHSPLHQYPLPLQPLPIEQPPMSITPQPTSEYIPLLTLPAVDVDVYKNLSSKLPPRHIPRKQIPMLKSISPVHVSTTPPPPPRTVPLCNPLQLSSQPDAEDSGSSNSDDPYLAFSMDLESLDISKLTLEQLDQIDPRQAQLWMLLKMHQMIRKVEDVYESAEQLYSIHQAPSPLPKKPNMQDYSKQLRKKNYENRLKRPVPTPRQKVARNQSDQEDQMVSSTNTSEAKHQEIESDSVKDIPQKTVKMYRQQKIIGKFSFEH